MDPPWQRTDTLQGCSFERKAKLLNDEFVPLLELIVEEMLFPQCIAEEIVVPQERFSERMVEQFAVFLPHQIGEEVGEAVQTFPQERCHHCTSRVTTHPCRTSSSASW